MPRVLINTYPCRYAKNVNCSRRYLRGCVELSTSPIWRAPLRQLIIDVARRSDLLSRQSAVSNQPYHLLCADEKLGCSWTTQGDQMTCALDMQQGTGLDTQFCHSYNYGTDLSFILRTSASQHLPLQDIFLVFRILKSLFLDY